MGKQSIPRFRQTMTRWTASVGGVSAVSILEYLSDEAEVWFRTWGFTGTTVLIGASCLITGIAAALLTALGFRAAATPAAATPIAGYIAIPDLTLILRIESEDSRTSPNIVVRLTRTPGTTKSAASPKVRRSQTRVVTVGDLDIRARAPEYAVAGSGRVIGREADRPGPGSTDPIRRR